MGIEDIVKQALVNQGFATVSEIEKIEEEEDKKSTQDIADTQTDNSQPITTEDEQLQELVAEVMIEFIRKQRISFAQLAQVRRTFKRILIHVCAQTQACTLSNIRNVIDPRYRKQVPLLLHEMTKAGLLTVYDDDTAKARWIISHKYKTQAVLYGMEK